MPILQRIELANFLNSRREKPWRPDWPHQVLEINGENAALNIPNGKGKSTMVTAILAMLTYHGRSLKDLRLRFFAPVQTGHFTHIRIQVLIPTPGAAGDLVTDAGGDVGGQPMVIGMYGYSGENEKLELYSYQGTFENCPVAHVHKLHHMPIADDAFLGQLKTCSNLFPSNHKERSKRAWLAFVEDFFDMSSLQQQLIYQLMRGAEGGHSYFDVKPPVGMNYSAAVFYERLAPELLTDVMGDLGEEGEHGIEDTIHEKVSKVIAAKRETERKTEELCRSGNTLKELNGLLEASGKLGEARQDYQKHQTRLSVEWAVLRDMVVDNPIPGLPKVPPAEVPEIAKAMVMREGTWFLPDRVMAEFTGESTSAVNQRAHDRNGLPLTQASRSQTIDFACDQKTRDARGRSQQLYSRQSAIGLLNVTSNFLRTWTRDSALDAVTRAFDWVEANSDTNPARRLSLQLSAELAAKEGEYQALTKTHRTLQEEKDELITEQSTVGAQQAEYRRMAESGLFSADELAAPSQTGTRVAEHFLITAKHLETHKNRVRDLREVHDRWLAFARDFGGTTTPAEQAAVLRSAQSQAERALTAAKSQLETARGQRKTWESAKTQAGIQFRDLDGKLRRYLDTLPATVAFAKLFGEVSPIGLERKVIADRDGVKARLATIGQARNQYRWPLDALSSFQRAHAGADPDEWLHQRLVKWGELGNQIASLQGELAEANQRLADYDIAVIVAGRVAREAAEVAGGDYLPLHAAIAEMALDDHQREKVLTLFSALLHTPVYTTLAEATAAAQRLAQADIEAPVFVRSELDSFCKEGDISADTVAAHTWLVGVRTRQVDCLLDPTLVAREKAREKERIATLTTAIDARTKERTLCSPEDEMAGQARRASEAVAHGYAAKDAGLAAEEETLNEQSPDLEMRASTDALDVIRQTVRHQKEFEGVDEALLREQHQAAIAALEQAEERLETNSGEIERLEGHLGDAQTALTQATIAASRIDDLLRIQSYVDHSEDNPAFMASADELEGTLTEVNERADKQTRFHFEAAEQFVQKGYDRPKKIEQRLQAIKEAQKELQDKRLPALEGDIETIRARNLTLIDQVREVDDFVRRLIARYRGFAAEQDELIPVAKDLVERHPLSGSAEVLRVEANPETLIRMLKDVDSDIDYEDSAEVGKEVVKAKTAFVAARTALVQAIDRMLVMPDLDVGDHVRIELQRAKEVPAIIDHLTSVAKQNYEKNQAANATAAAYLDSEWANLGKWLKAFTLRLPDNLKTMKDVFGPVEDKATGAVSAGFEIEAMLVDQEDIRAVLDDVVRKVEKFEDTRQVIENAAPSLRDQAIRGIRDEIRSTFYQKVITHPRIKVRMPSISQQALTLEKNMVSTGQGVAMTLLWIVKMADYITERELRRMTTNRVQQKHLHPTQFALMDGAFSSLSNKNLIRDALDSIKRTRGRFQLIITGHDENYQNNFDYFPTLVEAREVNGQFMYADSETRRVLQPEDVGSHFGAMGIMSLRVQPVETAGATPT